VYLLAAAACAAMPWRRRGTLAAVSEQAAQSPESPARQQAVIDLLGVLAYGELTAFERMAGDASLAPTVDAKVALAQLAVAEFGHFIALRGHLAGLGVDVTTAMEPFIAPLDAFHDSTAPADWLEGLVKAYVGDGFAADFYREVAQWIDDAPTRDLITAALADTGHAQFVVEQVRAAITEDAAVAGRLALWARRLIGEALAQAQRVAADREELTDLIVGGGDLVKVGELLTRLTQRHSERMASLGLTA
jgi:hypothetical protein